MKICPTCRQTYPEEMAFCPRDGARLDVQTQSTEQLLAPGLSRRFRLVRRLGAGGMGTVFLAEQIGVGNRPVALKVLNRKLLDDPDFLLRFQNEAGSTGRIHHANVVTIYESAQAEDGTPYIAMEFLEGESLRDALTRRRALPVPEVAGILQQTARGLNAAHKLGIIHRDLKPDNIFLTYPEDDGGAGVVPALPPDTGRAQGPPLRPVVVKVVDFGIAKLLRESALHTETGMVVGTPAYMSFEQASGMRSDDLDARSDVYSLGVVVYEMLTGRLPFQSDTLVGFLLKHVMDTPLPFRAVAPDVAIPPAVEAAVMKALVKERGQRYASALDFARELAKAAQPPPRAEVSAAIPATPIAPPPAAKVAHPPAPPPLGSPLEVRINPIDGLKYVRIPPGTFMMGCSPGDPEGGNEEKPPHSVTITQGFWLGQTPITVGAYRRFAAATGKDMPPAPGFNPDWRNEQMPMANVSWDDTQAYCAWAGGRLPTEAEWEYAARAGSTAPRYGDLDEIAWYTDNSGRERLDSSRIATNYLKRLNENGNATHEIGQLHANGFGLYDILGNVLEWVNDWYDANYYENSPSHDPAGPASGKSRVLRGGSWDSIPRHVRTSWRSGSGPAFSGNNGSYGFRCVWEADTSSIPIAPPPAVKVVEPPKQLPPESKPNARVNPKDGLSYVWIPPGTFMMGCSPGDTECKDDERPPHPVTISKGFWLGQTEVTVEAYKRFAGGTGNVMPDAPPFNPGWSNERMPMVNVSWDDAQAYCAWAGGRLPTEAEWEFAARGGKAEARFGPLDNVAWHVLNTGNGAHPVGEKQANKFGLYDMLGNVWEWVNDRYEDRYYQSSPSQDPVGPESGTGRVLRGESWASPPNRVGVSRRGWSLPDRWAQFNGFRCLWEITGD